MFPSAGQTGLESRRVSKDEFRVTIVNLVDGRRQVTGHKSPQSPCVKIELRETYKLPFQLLLPDNSSTRYRRHSDVVPYSSHDLNPWRGYTSPTLGRTGPWTYDPDREVSIVNWFNVSQGVYVCANGGNCIDVDLCECAEGW